MTAEVGTRLGGRYEILETVGRGGMSTVYKAKDAVLGRFVAVKVLHPQFSQDHEFLTRFRREAQSAACLIHPNIVTVYDTGEEDGTHYIIMEYIEGQQVKELIRERGPLPVQTALDIAKQVGQALAYAHRREIVHRDIKPHNVMLSADGRVRVTDFGIAKAASHAGITQDGTVLGTVQYLSPEQARGELADAQSDIYSLGICLYEMLTGLQPFRGDNPVEVALKHVQQELPTTTRHGEPVDPQLERIVRTATAKERIDRYGSADQMVEDLSALLALPERPAVGDDEERTRLLRAVRKAKKTSQPVPTSAPRPPVSATGQEAERSAMGPRPLLAWSVLVALVVIVVVLGYAAVKVVPPLVRRTTTPQPAAPVQVKLEELKPVAAKDFDPEGNDGAENPDLAGNTIDVDAETSWHTDIYNTDAFGNLKQGVGIYFDLGKTEDVRRVRVAALESGWDLVIKGSDTAPNDPAKWIDLTRRSDMPDKLTFNLARGKYRYIMLWITRLARNPSGDRYKVDIAEVLFYGRKL